MGVLEVIAAALKIIGALLDMHAKGQLTQEKLDLAVRLLEAPLPPKG